MLALGRDCVTAGCAWAGRVHLDLVTVVVSDDDAPVGLFVRALGFKLAEDRALPAVGGPSGGWPPGRPRWLPGGCLARAAGPDQDTAAGRQAAGWA
jgi:hypothetical protein